MNKTPQTDSDRAIASAIQNGETFRERGGTFQLGIEEVHENIVHTFQAHYGPAEYSDDGVLIPQEPIKGNLVGMRRLAKEETVAILAFEQPVTAPSPSTDPQPRVLQERDHHHQAPA